ncbi:four helix bundle sensory module for signal transduction family protein, partial [Vibrio parahaemolyticus EKP-026]
NKQTRLRKVTFLKTSIVN